MDAVMTRIAASVAAYPTVKTSVGALITELVIQIRAAADSTIAVNSLADELEAGNATLQNNVVEHTVAEDEPVA